MLDARVSDLREIAKKVIAHWGKVHWWKDRLWIAGRMHDANQAKLVVATALEQVGVTQVSTRHVNSVLLHVKSLAATDEVPVEFEHVGYLFGNFARNKHYVPDQSDEENYLAACEKYCDTPLPSWREVLRRLPHKPEVATVTESPGHDWF